MISVGKEEKSEDNLTTGDLKKKKEHNCKCLTKSMVE